MLLAATCETGIEKEKTMSTPQPLELDPSVEPLDFEAFARALYFYPTMTPLQASFLGGYAGASFLDLWDEDRDGPKPEYFGMDEDGLVLRVMAGQVGIDVWGGDNGALTRTCWFPLPRTFDEAFNSLLQLDDGWEEADRETLREEYWLECL
jgi:hypothetical protein